jgi:NADPH-dependent curcumin reductase CurA
MRSGGCQGVDVYFDNALGTYQAADIQRPQRRAPESSAGRSAGLPRASDPTFTGLLIVFRARMELPRHHYAHRYGGRRAPRPLVTNGELRWREHVTDGLENAPRAFGGMLRGENPARHWSGSPSGISRGGSPRPGTCLGAAPW